MMSKKMDSSDIEFDLIVVATRTRFWRAGWSLMAVPLGSIAIGMLISNTIQEHYITAAICFVFAALAAALLVFSVSRLTIVDEKLYLTYTFHQRLVDLTEISAFKVVYLPPWFQVVGLIAGAGSLVPIPFHFVALHTNWGSPRSTAEELSRLAKECVGRPSRNPNV